MEPGAFGVPGYVLAPLVIGVAAGPGDDIRPEHVAAAAPALVVRRVSAAGCWTGGRGGGLYVTGVPGGGGRGGGCPPAVRGLTGYVEALPGRGCAAVRVELPPGGLESVAPDPVGFPQGVLKLLFRRAVLGEYPGCFVFGWLRASSCSADGPRR